MTPVTRAGGLALLLVLAAAAALSRILPFPRAVLLALWTFWVAGDERATGPLVWREPLVAGFVAGLLIGHLEAGLAIGVVWQAIWPGLLPLGGSRQPAVGLATLVGIVWWISMPQAWSAIRLPCALAAALVAGGWSLVAEGWLRARNRARVEGAEGPGRWEALLRAGVLEAGGAGLLGLGLCAAFPLTLLSPGDVPDLAPLGSEAMVHLVLVALGGVVGERVWRRLRRGRRKAHRAPRSAREEAPAPPAPPLRPARWEGLLALQAAFSTGHLQRVGFLHLVRGAPGNRTRVADLERQLMEEGTLNTQPVMAAALIGALDRILVEREMPRSPLRLLELGGTMLAQWGDRAIWGGVRPGLALLALAFFPLWHLGVAIAFPAVGLVLHFVARVRLYRWGWRRGWDLVQGGTGWCWDRLPGIAGGMLVPLALVAAVSLSAFAGPVPSAFPSRGLWFMLGVPLGAAAGSRPLPWGCVCCGVAALDALAGAGVG